MIFDCKESGIECMNNYFGYCVEEIRSLGKEISLLSDDEISFKQFHKLSTEIDTLQLFPNAELYYKLLQLIDVNNGIDIKTFVVTIKQLSTDLEKML